MVCPATLSRACHNGLVRHNRLSTIISITYNVFVFAGVIYLRFAGSVVSPILRAQRRLIIYTFLFQVMVSSFSYHIEYICQFCKPHQYDYLIFNRSVFVNMVLCAYSFCKVVDHHRHTLCMIQLISSVLTGTFRGFIFRSNEYHYRP